MFLTQQIQRLLEDDDEESDDEGESDVQVESLHHQLSVSVSTSTVVNRPKTPYQPYLSSLHRGDVKKRTDVKFDGDVWEEEVEDLTLFGLSSEGLVDFDDDALLSFD
jgi:hypothetical protein